MKKADLHIHTNLSDGLLTPKEVIALAKKNNCETIAITDHDTISDFRNLAKENDIEIIPGIEFNTSVSSMHILGYGIDNIPLVDEEMTKLAKNNESVCYQVVDMMKKAGYDISIEKILDYIKQINLKHDILDKRRIVKYLIYKGYATNTLDAYDKLIGRTAEFYVPNYKISPFDIISLIDTAGGISVLAHPYTIKLSDIEQEKLLKELITKGLAGIEILNGTIGIKNKMYLELAEEHKLVKTIGSDFHDPLLSTIGYDIDDAMYNNFQEKLILKKAKR